MEPVTSPVTPVHQERRRGRASEAKTRMTAMLQIQKATWPRAGMLALPGFVFLLVTYVLPPPPPTVPTWNLLEGSWQTALTDAFLRRAQFGRDIVFTYGPWGFVVKPRGDPRIYPWLVGARLLITLAFLLGSSQIAVRRIRQPTGQFLFLAWIVLISDPVAVLPMVLLAAALPSKQGGRTGTTPVVHLLAIACALTMWVKFTGFVTVGALAGALAVQDFIKRRLPLISLEIAAASVAFWLLARQTIFALPSFLRGALSIALSYSAEMYLSGPSWELILAVLLMAAIGFPSVVLLFQRRAWFLWPSVAWAALLFFLQLKETFVRHDPFHVWMGMISALVPCALILLCRAGFFSPDSKTPQEAHIVTRTCIALAVILAVLFPVLELPGMGGLDRIYTVVQSVHSLMGLTRGRSLSADYQQRLQEFQRRNPLGHVQGTVDFFPDKQAMLYGNGMQVHLPPVPQAFSAYNSYLSGRNASFFRGANRPNFVFFDVAPIDNRYPSSSDPMSWLALMACYEPSGTRSRYLLLRTAACEETTLELVAETRTRVLKSVATPFADGYAIWAQIDIRLNWAGEIVAALTRPPLTELAVDTGMGRRTFRISPEAARMGFLLSPLLLDPSSFGRLFVEGGIDPQAEVRELTIIQSKLGQRLFEPAIGIRLYKIHFHRRV